MDLGLQGRTALVTPGGAAGAACTELLGAEGARVVSQPGDGVDIVVAHISGRSSRTLLACETAEELHDAWDAVVDAVDVYRQVLPGMTSRGWGRFVWLGSAGAKSIDADDDDLAAVVSLAMMAVNKVVAAEAGPDGVTANAVLRGGAATDADAAAAVAFLCSDGAGYISGVTVTVDGGAGSGMF